jgi:hypothetical protein
MSEALEPEADLTLETGDAGNETAAPDVSGETDEAIELEALAMGWKPESQFKGPKDKFVSAAEYVERGKTIMPFLRKELSQAYKKIEGLEKSVTSAVAHLTAAEKRGYEKREKELQAELRQAAQAGDVDAVEAITQDIVDHQRETIATAKEGDDEPDWFVDWKAENDWFGKDKARSASAAAFADEAMAEGYSGKALAKEVDRRLKEEFPHKYAKPENPARGKPGAVEGGGSPPRTRGKSYADLPPEAKAMCDEFVRDIPGFTREKYLKSYDWS